MNISFKQEIIMFKLNCYINSIVLLLQDRYNSNFIQESTHLHVNIATAFSFLFKTYKYHFNKKNLKDIELYNEIPDILYIEHCITYFQGGKHYICSL